MREVAHQGFHCIMYSVNCAIGVGRTRTEISTVRVLSTMYKKYRKKTCSKNSAKPRNKYIYGRNITQNG